MGENRVQLRPKEDRTEAFFESLKQGMELSQRAQQIRLQKMKMQQDFIGQMMDQQMEQKKLQLDLFQTMGPAGMRIMQQQQSGRGFQTPQFQPARRPDGSPVLQRGQDTGGFQQGNFNPITGQAQRTLHDPNTGEVVPLEKKGVSVNRTLPANRIRRAADGAIEIDPDGSGKFYPGQVRVDAQGRPSYTVKTPTQNVFGVLTGGQLGPATKEAAAPTAKEKWTPKRIQETFAAEVATLDQLSPNQISLSEIEASMEGYPEVLKRKLKQKAQERGFK